MSINILDAVNDVDEFNELVKFFHDGDVDRALELIVIVIANPDIAPIKVGPIVVECQGLAAKFGVLATYYTTIAKGKTGTENNTKKQFFYTLSEQMYRLSIALKSIQRGA